MRFLYWILLLIFLQVFETFMVQFIFFMYMLLTAAEYWQWVDSNFIDVFYNWIFIFLQDNIIVNMLTWPLKELMSTFFNLDCLNGNRKKVHFNPMNEFQAYFFVVLIYPWIYFFSLIMNAYQLQTIPVMLFWY